MRVERWSLAPSVRYDGSLAVAIARATAGEPLDVYDSRLKLWFVLVVSIVVVIAAVSLYVDGDHARGLYAVVSFFAGVWAARRLIAAGPPMIRFDREGVTINRSGVPLELPWSSLRSVYSRRRGGRTAVCLLPYDTAGVLATTPLGPRILMRLNMLVFGAPFTLPAALTLGDDSLMRIVYAYAPWFADEQPKVSRGSRPTAGR